MTLFQDISMNWYTGWILFMGYIAFTVTNEKIKCHEYCVCNIHRRKAVCSGMELSYIPRFSSSIIQVTMEHTNLSYIGINELYNLTFYPIIMLNLTKNHIKYIDSKAFMNMSYIRTLEISQQQFLDVNDVKYALSNLKIGKLTKLYLKNNQWNTLPSDMFKSPAVRNLRNVKMPGNRLEMLNCTIFKYMNYIYEYRVFDFSNNSMEDIILEGLPSPRYLYLNDNKLTKVPKMCKNSITAKSFQRLKTLHLANNILTNIGKNNFKCLYQLEVLNLEGNHIGRLSSNAFAVMPRIKVLMMSRIGNPLKQIQDFAFNSSSLTTLSLRSARFHFDRKRFNPYNVFAHCPNMTNLDLSHNILPKNLTIMKNMFMHLTKIRKLTLENTDIVSFPTDLFPNFRHLEILRLQGNKIYHLEPEIFGNMTALHTLDLRLNQMSIINETSFPRSLLMSLKKLNLYGNPFSCTCDQMWFLNLSKHIKLVDFHLYKCKHPQNMHGKLLKNYHPTVESCTPPNPLVIIALVVSVSGFIILLIIGIIVKCQTNIRNILYLVRISTQKRKDYLPIDDGSNFEYHAFVVYSEADSGWVHSEFIRRIEQDEGMKLCIHHREFDVGHTIIGNIDKFLQKSWKVVVILSNDFAKSEWCQWEVDVVQERRRKQGKNVCLLIMLKNIDSKHMTSQVRTLIDSTSCLKYSDGVGEDLFWKAVIEGLRKPIGHPPTSILID